MFKKEAVQAVYPQAIMYPPMKISLGTDEQLKYASTSGRYMAQIKKDGALYMFERHEVKDYLFSRTVSKKTGLLAEKGANVTHIMEALKCLPYETVILGEIYYRGGSSKNVVEIMGCTPEKAKMRQEGSYGPIHFYIYDILMYEGIDFVRAKTSNETRYKIVKKVFEQYNLSQYDFLELAETWEDNIYFRIGQALDAGEEGMVLKLKSAPYEPDKRPTSNLKAKKVDYIDAVIMGFDSPSVIYEGDELTSWQYWADAETMKPLPKDFHSPAYKSGAKIVPVIKSYFDGIINSRIKIGAYTESGELVNIGTIASGLSDEDRLDMSERPDYYLGKVCKIQVMETDNAAHTLRHGFYRGLHLEKNSEECLISEIFAN